MRDIYNILQAPVTGCDSQSTACGIELSPE